MTGHSKLTTCRSRLDRIYSPIHFACSARAMLIMWWVQRTQSKSTKFEINWIGALCLSCKHQDLSNMSGMFEDRELTEEGNTTPEGVSYGLSTGNFHFCTMNQDQHEVNHCLKKWSNKKIVSHVKHKCQKANAPLAIRFFTWINQLNHLFCLSIPIFKIKLKLNMILPRVG